MEFKYWHMYFVAVIALFAIYVSCARKSHLEKKVDALDNLVRSEVYLLNEKIETDRMERKELMKTLNETLDFLKTSQADRTDGAQVDFYAEGRQSDFKTLLENVEQNSKDIGLLAESTIRTRRGLIDEKKVRKANAKVIVTKLIQIEKSLNESAKQQNEIIINQNDIAKDMKDISTRIDALQNTTSDLRVSSHVISSDIKIIDDTTQTLSAQVKDISQKVTEVGENVASNLYFVNQMDSDASLQKHFTSMEGNITDMSNRINELQNTSAGIRITSGALSSDIRRIDNTTQNLVRLVNDISQGTQGVNKDIGTEQFCGNQMGLDACLQKHFGSHGNYLSYVQLLITNVVLVGGDGPYEGRVQINFQGTIGTICDDGWDNNDAKVVCRMCGYAGGTAFDGPRGTDGHRFGTGYGDILFENFDCTGSEQSLFSCNHGAFGVHDCSHGEDAGVRCQP